MNRKISKKLQLPQKKSWQRMAQTIHKLKKKMNKPKEKKKGQFSLAK